MTHTIHIIAGPTAGGKSALALDRAKALNGAIINCDSRQIYAALPILSAQPSGDDKKSTPHFLYGTLHPNNVCSAGSWRGMVMPIIEDCLSKNITPIITGGNGLYIKTLMEGISPIPDVTDEIRRKAIQTQKDMGNPAFYEELKRRDPATAALYHPNHTARLIHAWEILEATGKPLIYWQSLPKQSPPDDWVFDITLVMPPREILYDRCNRRFEQMLEMGAAEELAAFNDAVERGDISKDSVLMKTVGANALRAWRIGDISKDEAITLAQTETRQYAKRQMTWFSNQVKPAPNISTIQTKK